MFIGRFHKFFTKTLRRQLIFGVAVVHAILMSLFIYDLTERQGKILRMRQEEQAGALGQSLAITSASWLAAHDVAGLQELINAQRRYPELVFAMLTTPEGKVLAHTDPDKLGLSVTDMPAKAEYTVMYSTLKLRVTVPQPGNSAAPDSGSLSANRL